MIIGVDFDNTIISYDAVFHKLAYESSLIPNAVHQNKTAVRDYLRKIGKEDAWTELQGEVYGPNIQLAKPFANVLEFFLKSKSLGHDVIIVSHKTKFPYAGKKYDLHESAIHWLVKENFIDSPAQLQQSLFFENTKEAKLNRINQLKCDWFIDDLPEFLNLADFSPTITRCLFDPYKNHESYDTGPMYGRWSEISEKILG